jgi:galactose mutarotase-like enzyme
MRDDRRQPPTCFAVFPARSVQQGKDRFFKGQGIIAMFQIQELAEQWRVYRLIDEAAGSLVEVVPDRGGIITRWALGDRELLYLDRDRYADPALSIRGGIPILFPICGNLPDNRYQLPSGETGTLKQHGFARDLPWAVAGYDLRTAASLTVTLEATPDTLAVYPFPFRLEFTYRLKGTQLEIVQKHHNMGDRPMPFSTGLHPYFTVDDKAALTLDIPATDYFDQKNQAIEPYSGQLDFDREELDLRFGAISRYQATVTDRSQHSALELSFDESYGTLVFWTLKGKDFYCLEPWSAPRNALNTGDRLLWVAPGETHTSTVTLAIRPA